MSAPDKGPELLRLRFPAVTTGLTAQFARASGDANAVHFDAEAARAAGFAAPFAQGMLIMAWLGRLAEALAQPGGVRGFGMRFLAPVPIGTAVTGVAWLKGRQGEETLIGLTAIDGAGRRYGEGEARILARSGDMEA